MKMADDKIPVHAVVLYFLKALDKVPNKFLIEKLLDKNINIV